MIKIKNKKLQTELCNISQEIKSIKSRIEDIQRLNKKLRKLAYNSAKDKEIAKTIRKDRFSNKYEFDERFSIIKDKLE